MSQRNLLSGRDKELKELADAYETAQSEGRSFYADADDLADLADWYAMHRQKRRAFEVEEYGLRLHPGNTALLVELAYLYLDNGQPDKAEETAERIEETSLPEVLILQANLLNERGEWEEADRLIDTIADKDDLYNIIEIAYSYLDSDRIDKARWWIDHGKELYPDDPSFLGVLSDYYVCLGEWEKAAECYNTLIDTNPYSAQYWLSLAKAYLGMKQPGKALEACDYALVSEEQNGAIYLVQGLAYIEVGNQSKAIECFQTAHRYGAVSHGFVRVQQAQALMARGEWKKALQYFDEVLDDPSLQEDISPAFCYLMAALCLSMTQEDEERCEQYIEQGLQTADDLTELKLVLATIIRMSQGRLDLAQQSWRDALQYMPATELCYYTADQCLQFGLVTLAYQSMEALYSIDPDYNHITERMACISLVAGKEEMFRKYNSLSLHPLSAREAGYVRSDMESGSSPHEAFTYAMSLYFPGEEGDLSLY